MPENVVHFPTQKIALSECVSPEPPVLDVDSLYLRLIRSFGAFGQELKEFCAEMDQTIARGGMSRQEMEAVFLGQLVAAANIRNIDKILQSLSELRTETG